MKFQHWIAAFAFVLVAVMTVVFLLTVLDRFRSVSEENAQGRFAIVAAKAAESLENRFKEQSRRAQAMASGPAHWFQTGQHLNTDDLMPVLMASLRTQPDVYSEYFGLSTGEFLQVVAIRSRPLIVQALHAPESAHFGVRSIVQAATGERLETWRFLSETGQLLDQRSAPAKYDPSVRPWYLGALQTGGVFLTDPYLFSSTQRSGLTLATPLSSASGVYGVDLSLDMLPELLKRLPLSPNAFIGVLDRQQRLVAGLGHGKAPDVSALSSLSRLDESTDARLSEVSRHLDGLPSPSSTSVALQGVPHVLTLHTLSVGQGSVYQVVSFAPASDFTAALDQARNDVLLMAAAVLLLLIPLSILGTNRATRALVALAADSERLKRLDFSRDPQHIESFLYEVNSLGEAQEVMHRSVKERTRQLQAARKKLAHLVDNGIQMGREKDHTKLLRQILSGGREIAQCAAGTLYLKTEHNTLQFALRTSDDELPSFELPLYDALTGEPIHRYVATHAALTGQTIVIDDVYSETRFDLSGTKEFSEASGFRTVSMLTVPLMPRAGEVIGLLQLMNAQNPDTGEVVPFDPEVIGFVEALATQAAVAMENQRLLTAQEAMIDAMIKLIAGSIDAKSPYTAGHCARVPELAMLLAQEASKSQEGPLADFRFETEEEWREFRIGAWLHDCGKVTSPEYVVDKATKLETIYNRIHEIRARFEILWRDARIEHLQAVHEQHVPLDMANARLHERQQQLQEDFVFLARCNIGGESMDEVHIERLQTIAAQTWWRHFDDRLGLSAEELTRHEQSGPASPLPALESLLADKPAHLVPRPPGQHPDPKYGFKVNVPEHLYNQGELYNLSIGRGTLTAEERFKINEHIIQTIIMLERLPLPKNLRRVPEYAGTHHETLDGTGYPRKLTERELSIPARIMAIADIFEALTASDRPYKKAKTLSESIHLLARFKQDRHIDPVLFDLFLRSGVYLRYAEQYLHPEQIDDVDVGQYLS